MRGRGGGGFGRWRGYRGYGRPLWRPWLWGSRRFFWWPRLFGLGAFFLLVVLLSLVR